MDFSRSCASTRALPATIVRSAGALNGGAAVALYAHASAASGRVAATRVVHRNSKGKRAQEKFIICIRRAKCKRGGTSPPASCLYPAAIGA